MLNKWRLSKVEKAKSNYLKNQSKYIKGILLSLLYSSSIITLVHITLVHLENYILSIKLGSEFFLESRIGVCVWMGAHADVYIYACVPIFLFVASAFRQIA